MNSFPLCCFLSRYAFNAVWVVVMLESDAFQMALHGGSKSHGTCVHQ